VVDPPKARRGSWKGTPTRAPNAILRNYDLSGARQIGVAGGAEMANRRFVVAAADWESVVGAWSLGSDGTPAKQT